jgi:hypothetical protein
MPQRHGEQTSLSTTAYPYNRDLSDRRHFPSISLTHGRDEWIYYHVVDLWLRDEWIYDHVVDL